MRRIKWVCAFFFSIGITTSFSQTSTISPYSRYGIGVLRSESFLQNFSLGGIGLGLKSNIDINISNPASYSEITLSTFEVGFTNNSLSLDDGIQQQSRNNPYIDHIAFAFPIINKRLGMSFGLLPISTIGYDFTNVLDDPIAGDVSIFSNGNGGLNKAYLGTGFSFYTDSLSTISFGVNGNFIFGSTQVDERIVYGELSNSLNLWFLEEKSIADVNVDFGVQYQKVITKYNEKTRAKDTYKFTIGAIADFGTDLNGKRTEIIRTFSGSADFGVVKDTISFIDEADNITRLPTEYGIGFSIEKFNKWLIGVDYKTANWSSIASNDPVFDYNSNYMIAAGFQFIPKYNDYQGSYLNRITYRFGGRYSTSYILVNNQKLNEYGITFGVKLPLRRSGTSFPGLSLGGEYGSRGQIENNLIRETFFNFNVGVTINDKWFNKRKYD